MKDKNKSSKCVEQQSCINYQQEIVNLNDTAIPEYFEIVRSEYEIERNKRQSFENRAEIVMALLGAICIFIFEKVKLKNIFLLMTSSLTFIDLIKIISGLAVYVCFAITIITITLTIMVKEQDNFEVKCIDESLLSEERLIALCKIIFTYRDIIIQHRTLNEKRAKAFKMSLCGTCATFVSIIIYISLI